MIRAATAPQRRASFYTLGCRLNHAETALIAQRFVQAGYAIAEHGEPVDVAVIHTCSVTERADARCRQEIRKVRRGSPDAVVCAVGCYAQAEPATVAALGGVDFVVGNDRKYDLVNLIGDVSPRDTPRIDVSRRVDLTYVEYPVSGYYARETRANIKIQDGCNFCCAFCILPRIRGRAQSRRLGDIIAEGHELARRGHKELVITGVNIGTYTHDRYTIADVARALSAIPDVQRVRISSVEPTTVSDDLLDWMANDPRACRHLHLPLQAGSDSVLSKMKRVYTVSDYVRFIEKAMRMIPDLGLGTDIIVGHPGEGDAEFTESVRFVEAMPYSYLHVFSYSERPKTAAAFYDDKIDPRVIKERSEIMHEIGRRKRQQFFERHIGRTVDVLFESVDDDGWCKGFTGSYVRVGILGSEAPTNEIRAVEVQGRTEEYCLGVLRAA